MEFVILFLLNLAGLALMYIILRKKVDSTYTHDAFLKKVNDEIGLIITEMNQTTERNIQVLEHKLESLQNLSTKVQDLLVMANDQVDELQNRYSQLKLQKIYHKSNFSDPQVRQGDRISEYSKSEHKTSRFSDSNSTHNAHEVTIGSQVSFPSQGEPTQAKSGKNTSTPKKNREEQKKEATKLFLQGEELPEIAGKTGLSLGEVELIAALLRR